MGNVHCPNCGAEIGGEAEVSACPNCSRPFSADELRDLKALEEKYAGYNAMIEYQKLKSKDT